MYFIGLHEKGKENNNNKCVSCQYEKMVIIKINSTYNIGITQHALS